MSSVAGRAQGPGPSGAVADKTAALLDEVFMAECAGMFYQHTEARIVDSSAIEKAYGLVPDPLAATPDSTLDRYGGRLASR